MATQESTGWCPHCRRQVLLRRKGTNHILHLILTLLTCVWGIVWILTSIRVGGWRCTLCGQKVNRDLTR